MNSMDRFSANRVLVTGASGFIGSHLCRRLTAVGAEVHGVYRSAVANDADLARGWQIDVSEAAAVRKLVADVRPDVVFHLASFVSGSRSLDAVLPALQSNLVSTVNLLTAATEFGCRRIVLAGSLEEPGSSDGPAVPSSPYAAAKFAASAYARMFHVLYQTPVVTARIFMVYGPGQRDLRKLVPYVTLSLLRKQVPQLSSGKRQVDWIYVEDVVEGLLAAAQAPDVIGSTIDLGSGTFASVGDVVHALGKIIAPDMQLALGGLPDRPLEQVRLADVAGTYSRLGWKPAISLEEGLRRTVDWYARRLREGAFSESGAAG